MKNKNDIEFNININKKLGVVLLTACGLFAMAEHQSTFSGDTPVISQSCENNEAIDVRGRFVKVNV